MSEELILERLRLCYLDIDGVQSAAEMEQAESPSPGSLPYVETAIGPQVTNRRSHAEWDVTGQFLATAYIAGTASSNTPDKGMATLYAARVYPGRFRRYFMANYQLQTSSLAKLAILVVPLQYEMVSRLGILPDNDLIGFQFRLTLQWREYRD